MVEIRHGSAKVGFSRARSLQHIDIAFITYNCADIALRCVESLKNVDKKGIFRPVAVDNASTDDTAARLAKAFPDVEVVVNEKNLGYAAAVNIAAKITTSDPFIVANSDLIFSDNSIFRLIEELESDVKAGIAAPAQVYPNGSWQPTAGNFPGFKLGIKKIAFVYALENIFNKFLWKIGVRSRGTKSVDTLDGALLAFRRAAFESVGGFDEDYFFYTEETDFCKRISEIGLRRVFVPSALITHYRGASGSFNRFNERSASMIVDSKILFLEKHCSRAEKLFYIAAETFYFSIYCAALFPLKKIFRKKFAEKYAELSTFRQIWLEKLKENI